MKAQFEKPDHYKYDRAMLHALPLKTSLVELALLTAQEAELERMHCNCCRGRRCRACPFLNYSQMHMQA